MIMVSFIIPIYKAEEFLYECLLSVQLQTYQNFEVICVNDGSPDNSAQICQKFIDTDSRFHIINQENGGVSSARNTGIENANGELICFVDADDKLHKDYLSHLLQLFQANTLPVCSFASTDNALGTEFGKKEYNAEEFIKHIFSEDIKHPNLWAMLFERKIIEDNCIRFYPGCIKNEDTEFYVKYITKCEKVVISAFKGYYYRSNPHSVMNSGLNMKSLTSLDAQKRMAQYLVDVGIYSDHNYILSNSVQVYVLSSAKNNNMEIYEFLHRNYDVKMHMKIELHHPRLGRKMVSLAYLLLGRKYFFYLFSKFKRQSI